MVSSKAKMSLLTGITTEAKLKHKIMLVNITGGHYGCHAQTQVASQYYNTTILNLPVSISSPTNIFAIPDTTIDVGIEIF
jgi:hypothetical protein